MKHLAKFFAFALFVCAGAVCADAQDEENKGWVEPDLGFQIRRDNRLEGVVIDLLRSRDGAVLIKDVLDESKRMKLLHDAIATLDKNWMVVNIKNKHSVSPTKCYTTGICIQSWAGRYNTSYDSVTYKSPIRESHSAWLCFYEGYFGVPEEGDYRFVGYANPAMLVGVDNGVDKKVKTVLYAFPPLKGYGSVIPKCGEDWEPANFCGKHGNDGIEIAERAMRESRAWLIDPYKGSWLHLVPGKRYSIKIAFGAVTHHAIAILGIQKKGRDTDNNFPVFTLEKLRGSETGRYNRSCAFPAPKEQPAPATTTSRKKK